jgi:ankyrin repeat protein
LVVELGADINKAPRHGHTPLIIAAAMSNMAVVR